MTTFAALDPALLFIVVIVASIINAIVKAVREKGDQQEPPQDVAKPMRGDSEAERMRKFMEALGVPSAPPPPVTLPPPPPRADPAPAVPKPKPTGRHFAPPVTAERGFPREAMSRLPPERTREAPVPVLTEATPPLALIKPAAVDVATAQLAEKFASATTEREAEGQPYALEGVPRESWGALLRDPKEQRKAIVLREIFGPPRSLQSLS